MCKNKKKNEWIAVTFYTEGTPYESLVPGFRSSASTHRIPVWCAARTPREDWAANCAMKPAFIQECVKKFSKNYDYVVWVDVDARFRGPCALFSDPSFIAPFAYRRFKYEILSGTVAIKTNCEISRSLLAQWIERQTRNLKKWDQAVLADVLKEKHFQNVGYELPPEYVYIFDEGTPVQEPQIVHYQKSRVYKKIVKQ